MNGTLLSPRVQIVSAGYAIRAQIAEGVPDDTVTGAKIVDGTIEAQDLADGSVTMSKINSAGASTGQAVMFDGSNVKWDTPAGGGLGLPYSGGVSSTSTAFSVSNTGTGGAARFEVGPTGSSASGVYASAASSGAALQGVADQRATAVKGEAVGQMSRAAWFATTDPANAKAALYAETDGTGIAAEVLIDNATSTSSALDVETGGLGHAGQFSVTNSLNSEAALHSVTSGDGPALTAETSGLGSAAYFSQTNPLNSAVTLSAETEGTGSAGQFRIINPGTAAPALYALTAGTGPAIKASAAYAGEFLGKVLIDNLAGPSSTGLEVNHGNVLVKGPNWGTGQTASVNLGDDYNWIKAVYGEGLRLGVYPGVDGLVVSNGGNVGIGTYSPTARLEVNGDVSIATNATVNGDTRVKGDLTVDGDLVAKSAFRGTLGPNNGAPFPRPAYDSGWVSINKGELKTLAHNVGGSVYNYVVDFQSYGSTGGWGVNGPGGRDIDGDSSYGASWANLTDATVQLFRRGDDLSAEMVRLRIWVCN